MNEANDNRIYDLSNQAFGVCRLQYPYCTRGIVSYVRVHFVKTQVQLRLDQHSSFPHEYGITLQVRFAKTQTRRPLEPSKRGVIYAKRLPNLVAGISFLRQSGLFFRAMNGMEKDAWSKK